VHRNPRLLILVAAVISLPILFGTLGGTSNAGLIIGIVLVVVGIASGLVGGRRSTDGDDA
jgi:hypothetical protein